MRLPYWLLLALSCSVACASDKNNGGVSDVSDDDGDRDDDEDDDEDGDEDGERDAGPKSDGAAKPPSDDDDDGGEKPFVKDNTCDSKSLLAKPQSPDILIVLDRSGSMVGFPFGVDRWTPSTNAVMKLTENLTATVKFGLMLFPAVAGGGGGGGGFGSPCEPGKVSVPIALNSAPMIASTLAMSRPDIGSTPTASALTAALDSLDAPSCPDCGVSKKYVLLVTDGAPTCSNDPVNDTNRAIDALTAADIPTYVIGYGTSDAATASVMDGFASHGGTDRHYAVEDEQSLVAELTRIAGSLVPCEYELENDIEDPKFVSVKIDGVEYFQGRDWHVEGRKIILDEDAEACATLRDAKVHDLQIKKECIAPIVF